MAIRDILLVLTTYPQPTPISAVDEAVAFAVALGARVSAIACEVKIRAPRNALAERLLDVAALAAEETKKSSTNAKKLLVAFQDAAEKHGILQDRILEPCLTSEVADLLIRHARLRDLAIVPVRENDPVDQQYAEPIIFGSGRPTLIMPSARKRRFAVDSVVVAWDFGRAAARAIADSLPVLEKAKQVWVVTVTNEKAIDVTRSSAELAKHLARHGVNNVLDTVDAAGRGIGEVLESYVAKRRADLLVMGAYGHSRIREFILGGATKSMLSRPPLPIFLSH